MGIYVDHRRGIDYNFLIWIDYKDIDLEKRKGKFS
jgi:hypothetical protein